MATPDYDEIRKRIEQRFTVRREFFMHLAAYIGVNLAIWALWAILRHEISPIWPMLVSLLWGAGLVVHGIDFYFKSGAMDERRERAIQREIARQRRIAEDAGETYIEKPKRDAMSDQAQQGTIRLSDEGELIYDDHKEDHSRTASGKKY